MALTSLDVITSLCAAYPQTELSSHLGTPDVRVRGKIFAMVSRTSPKAVLKLPLMVQESLVQSDPQAFEPDPGWGRHGWTILHTDKIDAVLLRDLVDVSWRQVAPKTLAAAHGGTGKGAG